MSTQFDEFLGQLSFREPKKSLVRKLLVAFNEKATLKKVDVWVELYNINTTNKGYLPKVTGVEIISKLREYLANKQNNRCCYCQRYLFNIAYARPVEHILPRSHYPRFSLMLKNLAIACYDCNLKKSNTNWWPEINPDADYPDASQLDKAFHYNQHSYDDHIYWIRYATNNFSFSAYGGLSDVGKKLYIDLLHDISKSEILLCNEGELKKHWLR